MQAQSHRGFTLIELMIGLAIAAILLALAAPSFQQVLNSNRLSTGAEELMSAVNLARAEAVRANRRAVICRSANGSACDGTDEVWPGWILFIDRDADDTRDADEAVIRAGEFDANLVVTSSPNITAVSERIAFRADGVARASDNTTLLTGTLSVCMKTLQPAQNVRDLSLAFGSRTTISRRNGLGACAVPADS